MIRTVKILAAVLTIGTLTSCPGGKDNPSDENPSGAPSAATLVFPDNNLECNEGTILNDAQSTVVFQWQAAANTTSYEVHLRNLNANTSTITNANTNEASITLDRGVPYEWFVISKSDDTDVTAQSEVWRFFNAGAGVVNYAPFPAVAVSPTRGQTVSASNSIHLEWEGNDVDNDLAEFQVFFGSDNPPAASLGTTSQSTISASIGLGQTYYWRVISKDEIGNTSQSDVFDFRVR